jgi:hypothetical protein
MVGIPFLFPSVYPKSAVCGKWEKLAMKPANLADNTQQMVQDTEGYGACPPAIVQQVEPEKVTIVPFTRLYACRYVYSDRSDSTLSHAVRLNKSGRERPAEAD